MFNLKKLMTICVGVLALTAFASAPAMGQWMVNGTTLTAGQTKALATTAATEEAAKLKAAGVTITCSASTLTGTGPQIEANGEMGSATSLTFNTCAANENCKVPTSIGTVALLVSTELDIAGDKDRVLLLFLPKTKNTFATIKFEGEKCALLGTQPVTGKAKVLAPNGGLEATLQLISAAVSEASAELKVGSSGAELTGKANLKLASGEPWSILLP